MADEADTTIDASLEGAADALAKARQAADDGNKQQEPADNAPAATDGPEEMPDASTETHDAKPEDTDDTATATIEYPPGWNADDQAWFDTLEPARQETILRREKGTQAAESRRQNEHQTAMREAQEAAQQAAQERQYLQSALQHYKHPIVTSFQHEFADVVQGQTDLFRLAQDPERWNRYQAFQSQFQALGQAERQLAERREQEDVGRLQQHIEARNARIVEAMPEYKDPAKFQKFDEDLSNFLRAYNVPDDRIAKISFEEVDIVQKAMKWDAAQKAKANAPKAPALKPGQTAVQGHVRQLPRVIKPGTPSSAGGHDDKIAAAKEQLRKTGSVDDAALAIRQLLNKSRVSA